MLGVKPEASTSHVLGWGRGSRVNCQWRWCSFNSINIKYHNSELNIKGGCSSNGRALALHARGTGFDPLHLHSIYIFPFLLLPYPIVFFHFTSQFSSPNLNYTHYTHTHALMSVPLFNLAPDLTVSRLCLGSHFSPKLFFYVHFISLILQTHSLTLSSLCLRNHDFWWAEHSSTVISPPWWSFRCWNQLLRLCRNVHTFKF